MGYYILGTIIFLLLIVFISDLLRNSKDNRSEDFDNDEYFNRLSSQYPGTFAYKEEFSEENFEDDIETEEDKISNRDDIEPNADQGEESDEYKLRR